MKISELRAAAEKEAVRIAEEFRFFCGYLLKKQPKLSGKTGRLSKKDCFVLNRKMTVQEDYKEPTRLQKDYPVLNLFHYIAFHYRILETDNKNGTVREGARYSLYRRLPTMEKYLLFVLNVLHGGRFAADTFEYRRRVEMFYETVEENVLRSGSICGMSLEQARLWTEGRNRIMPYLEVLGLARAENGRTVCGGSGGGDIRFLPAFDLVWAWFERSYVPGELFQDSDEAVGQVLESYLGCIGAAKGESLLDQLLQDTEITFEDERIELEVLLCHHACRRTICMNLSDSLYNLKNMIFRAFEMNGRNFSIFSAGRSAFAWEYHIWGDEWMQESLPDEALCLGELGLYEGRSIWCSFEYDDEYWEFEIKVKKIGGGVVPEPIITKSEGVCPWLSQTEHACWFAGIDENLTVKKLLEGQPDELLRREYAALTGEKGEKPAAGEMRESLAGLVLNEPEKVGMILPAEERSLLSELVKETAGLLAETDPLSVLSGLGLCTVPDSEETEIRIPGEAAERYRMLVCDERMERLDDAEIFMKNAVRRCGVIETDELYALLQRNAGAAVPQKDAGILPAREGAGIQPAREDAGIPPAREDAGISPAYEGGGIQPVREGAGIQPVREDGGIQPAREGGGILPSQEECRLLINGRMCLFGCFFCMEVNGREYVSCYEDAVTEKILSEREKTGAAFLEYPDSAECAEGIFGHKEWRNWFRHVKARLNADGETADLLIRKIPLLISGTVEDKEEVLEQCRKLLNGAGLRMGKKTERLLGEMYDHLPAAAGKGRPRVNPPEEPYRQLKLFE